MFYKIYVGIYFLGKKVLEMQILQNVRNYCQTLIKHRMMYYMKILYKMQSFYMKSLFITKIVKVALKIIHN